MSERLHRWRARWMGLQFADRVSVALLFVLALSWAIAVVSAGIPRWYPTGDMAQAELHMRGFFRHPPLVGAAGRIGSFQVPYGQGSHPGPAMWVAMLPIYLLSGRSAFGLLAAVGVVQLAFIALTVGLTRRLAGPTGGTAAAVLLVALARSMGSSALIEPWNPWLALFAFAAFVTAVWGVILGQYRWMWLVVGCGTFALQCHVGYLGLVAVGIGAATAGAAARARRSDAIRPTLVSLAGAAALGVLMWIPPVLEQLRRQPGNLRILYHHFTASTGDDGTPRQFVGLGAAIKAFLGEFGVPGQWIAGPGRQPLDPLSPIAMIGLLASVAVSVLLWRRAAAPARATYGRLWIVVGILSAAGVASTARIFGEFYDYVIRWWWVLAALAALPLVALAAERADGFRPRSGTSVLAVLGAIGALSFTADAMTTETPAPEDSSTVAGVAPLIADALDRDSVYLARYYDPASLGGVPFGVILELERSGLRVGVDAPNSAAALPHRVLPEDAATHVLWIVTGQRAIDHMRARSDATEVAFFDARTPADQVRSRMLRAEIEERLTSEGLDCWIPVLDTQYGLVPFTIGASPIPRDIRILAGEYDVLGLPVAAFVVPPGSAGYTVETSPDSC